MAFWQRLLDRLTLQPTVHPVDVQNKRRLAIAVHDFEVEVWATPSRQLARPSLLLLRFPGTAGRAERTSTHPLEVWRIDDAEVWSINHRGYGGSHGPASLQNFSSTCDAVWREAQRRYANTPVLVMGSSLGCLSALYVSARYPVAGVMLRNGFDLAELISKRRKYNWWNLGAGRRVAHEVPVSLSATLNAQRSQCPGLFVRSASDRLIPEPFQVAVYDAFAGRKHEFLIIGADHHEPVPDNQAENYVKALNWLRTEINI